MSIDILDSFSLSSYIEKIENIMTIEYHTFFFFFNQPDELNNLIERGNCIHESQINYKWQPARKQDHWNA